MGESALLVHDEHRDNPGLAFQLSRLSRGALRADADRRVPRRRPTGLRGGDGRADRGRHRPARRRATWPPCSARARPGRSTPTVRRTTPRSESELDRASGSFVAMLREHQRRRSQPDGHGGPAGPRDRVSGSRIRATYLQSGNVVFRGRGRPESAAEALEDAIARELGLSVPVVARSARQLQRVVDTNPMIAAGEDPSKLHVTFLSKRPAADRLRKVACQQGAGSKRPLQGSGRRGLPPLPPGLWHDQATTTPSSSATWERWRPPGTGAPSPHWPGWRPESTRSHPAVRVGRSAVVAGCRIGGVVAVAVDDHAEVLVRAGHRRPVTGVLGRPRG